MKLAITALLLIAGTAQASDWILKTSTDLMTDETQKEAFVANDDGDKFTVIRRSDNSVWGYLQLSKGKQFSINERLMLRIDKNKPLEYNDDLQKLARRVGNPLKTWEWNPSLIGFRIWHGEPKKGCGLIKQLFNGSRLIARYHPNYSTTRDTIFSFNSHSKAMAQAIDFDVTQCIDR